MRGYLIGSGWKDYCKTGRVSGVALPKGLELAERLREPIFTPSTKAAAGKHDENISMADAETLLGAPLARKVRDVSLQLYARATEHARARGIIIADTKFEFGLDADGNLHVIDELLTPDSSRFWPADTYQPGSSPAELRQAIRARLSRDARLGQDGSRPASARRGDRAHAREILRGAAPPRGRDARMSARSARLARTPDR